MRGAPGLLVGVWGALPGCRTGPHPLHSKNSGGAPPLAAAVGLSAVIAARPVARSRAQAPTSPSPRAPLCSPRRGVPGCRLAATAPVDCLPCEDVPSPGVARKGRAGGGVSNVNHLAEGQTACPPACGMSHRRPPLGRSLEAGGGPVRRVPLSPHPFLVAPRVTATCGRLPSNRPSSWALRAPRLPRNERPRRPFPCAARRCGCRGAGRLVVRGVGPRSPHARAPLPPPLAQHVHFPLACLPGRTRRTSVHVAAACSLSVICHVPPVHGRLGHRPARPARSGVELGRAPTGGCRLGHRFVHPRARLPPRGPCRRRRAPPPCRRSSPLPPVTPPPVVRAIRGGGSRGPGPSACCGWCRVWGGSCGGLCRCHARRCARSWPALLDLPLPLAGGGPVREPGCVRLGGGGGDVW